MYDKNMYIIPIAIMSCHNNWNAYDHEIHIVFWISLQIAFE